MPHPRLSQAALDKYAEPIALALTAYPGVVRYDLIGSSETFSARFRDAIKGALKYGHTNLHVSPILLKLHGLKLSVSMRDGYVLIGPKESIRSKNIEAITNKPPKDTPEIKVDLNDTACAVYLCELIKHKAFPGPIVFTVGPLTQETATKLELEYGVTMVPVDGETDLYTLLP